jgi:hypothetical protein
LPKNVRNASARTAVKAMQPRSARSSIPVSLKNVESIFSGLSNFNLRLRRFRVQYLSRAFSLQAGDANRVKAPVYNYGS